MNSQTFEPTLEQQAVICHDGSAFVTACPGAGKTRIMTERARRLFEDMPSGQGVAFLSFTRGAIFELETRLREEAILPVPVFPSFIGTFDSFVWQFLVAPFGVKGCDARPRLIADLADFAITPFNGAQPLPLSCFCPNTGILFEQKAKVHGFDASQRSDHQVQTFLLVIGATWGHIRLSDVAAAIGAWISIVSMYGFWVALQLGAVWGTSRGTPIAGAGFEGTAWQERVVEIVLQASSGAAVFAATVIVVGFWRGRGCRP